MVLQRIVVVPMAIQATKNGARVTTATSVTTPPLGMVPRASPAAVPRTTIVSTVATNTTDGKHTVDVLVDKPTTKRTALVTTSTVVT